jgi:hypothetical protein
MDALRPLGIKNLDMPLTPFKIWEAMQQRLRPALPSRERRT